MSMAQITLIGNLGRDPDMSYTSSGIAVTKFSLAVSRKQGDKETTTWFNCTAFRGLAETLNTHLRKGQQVFLQGELQQRNYTTRDGQPGVSIDVVIDKFQFLGTKGSSTGGEKSSASDDADDLGDLDESPF